MVYMLYCFFFFFFKPFSIFSNLRALFTKSFKMDKKDFNENSSLKSFLRRLTIGEILADHLRMGEVFFISREKEKFSFFNLGEYKNPFKNSLKYFAVEVRKSLFSPAKNLKIFFFNLYSFRKMESLRKVHSIFLFNKVKEWKGRLEHGSDTLVNKSSNRILKKKKLAYFLRKKGLKNRYIKDMKVSRKKI